MTMVAVSEYPTYVKSLILPTFHFKVTSILNLGRWFLHYVNVSVLIKFSQKTSVFSLIIISSP